MAETGLWPETPRQARCSTRVSGAKPRRRTVLQALRPCPQRRETVWGPTSITSSSASAHHSGAKLRHRSDPGFRATPRSELSRHRQSITWTTRTRTAHGCSISQCSRAHTSNSSRSVTRWVALQSEHCAIIPAKCNPQTISTAASAMAASMRSPSPPAVPSLVPPGSPSLSQPPQRNQEPGTRREAAKRTTSPHTLSPSAHPASLSHPHRCSPLPAAERQRKNLCLSARTEPPAQHPPGEQQLHQ